MARHASTALPSAQRTAVTQPSQGRLTELGLMILAWIIVASFYVLASLGAQGHLPTRLGVFLTFIVAISLALHFAIRFLAPNSSQVLLPIATLLNGVGYVEIARWNPEAAGNQALWVLISAAALVVVLIVVRHVRDLDRYRYLTLLTALGLLLLPLIPHIGIPAYLTGGARLWVKVGPISFQPVEIAKILLVFFFASYFAANRELLSTPTQRIGRRQIVPPKTLLPILFAWGFSIAILGAENDIGFAMLLFALFISMLWVTTGLKTYVVLAFALFGGGLYVAAHYFTQIHDRVTLWLDPWAVCAGVTNNCQIAWGWYAMASGGVTGTGLGLANPVTGNIPELTSDMIFAAIGEELGFIGIILLICLFASFVGEGFHIAQKATSDYVRLAAAGVSALLGFQAFIIMAGILRILPFTGITLPFVAYGGSSLFANYVIVALLLRISDENALDRRGGEIVAVKFKKRQAVDDSTARPL